jgi:glycosyltransferase involved in cell wall biosynthesis
MNVGPASDRRSVSIVISNWNYGHFVADCIESALDQSEPPDEIIVVDDGSTDNSVSVLARYFGRITTISKPNGGQSSALNAGFAASTGDIIFFIDADDLLRPEAVETVKSNWWDGISSLSYGLELVDGEGKSRGLYEQTLIASEGDNRPQLLARGSFSFAPTSGNAFSREFLRKIMPMNEERWRISADAFLLKAAALHGKMVVLRHVLGAYRTHNGNNYYREYAPDLWRIERGVSDIADVLSSLAEMGDLPARTDRERELLRLRLRLCSLEVRARLIDGGASASAISQVARNGVVSILHGNLAIREKVAALGIMTALALLASRSSAIRLWLYDSRRRPTPLLWILSFVGYRKLEAEMDQLQRPRNPINVRYGEELTRETLHPLHGILAEGWLGDPGSEPHWSSGETAMLEFRLDPTPHTSRVEIKLQAAQARHDHPLQITAEMDGRRLSTVSIHDQASLVLDLPREILPQNNAIRLRLRCAGQKHAESFSRQVLKERPYFAILALRASELRDLPSAPFLKEGTLTPFADLVSPNLKSLGWRIDGAGVPRMIGFQAKCVVSIVAQNIVGKLIFTRAAAIAPGWLHILCNEVEIFSGDANANLELHCRMPRILDVGASTLEFKFVFATYDPTNEMAFGLAGISLIPLGEGNPYRYYRLNLAQKVLFHQESDWWRIAISGWGTPDKEGVCNNDVESSLGFNLARGTTDLCVRLKVRSHLPESSGIRHIAGISEGGKMLFSAQIVGAATIEFALPTSAIQRNGDVLLIFHSFLAEGGPFEVENGATPALARISLVSMSVQGVHELTKTNLQFRVPYSYPQPEISSLLTAAERELVAYRLDPLAANALPELRAQIVKLLMITDLRELAAIVSRSNIIQTIDAIGVATAFIRHAPVEEALLKSLPAGNEQMPSRNLRSFLCYMLLVPAYRIPIAVDLLALPDPLIWSIVPIAQYLARDPELIDSDLGVTDLLAYADRLLRGVEAILASEPKETVHYRLAVCILNSCHFRKVLFGEQNLLSFASLKARCFERYLSQSGCMLALGRPTRRSKGRLRVGVLVRDILPNPEGWLLLGMYQGLDRQCFETILIVLTQSEDTLEIRGFDNQISLAELTVSESVAAVRELDLDIFVLGAFFNGFEKLSAIVAHKLAATQILCAAISPMTSGLRSFNYAISCFSSEPEGAETHYSERLIRTSGPLQCFAFEGLSGRETQPESKARRDALGIPTSAVAVFCGAMQDKIVPKLADCWAQILLANPDAVLVLYPFASNWSQTYSVHAFHSRLYRHFDSFGIDRERIIVLSSRPPNMIRQALSEADLYLDSFPYAGATTVVEALSCGVPVVSLAGTTQRGLQGASWLIEIGLSDLVASSVESYIAKASSLINDAVGRAAVKARLVAILAQDPPPYSDVTKFGCEFSSVLRDLATRATPSIPVLAAKDRDNSRIDF